MHLPNGLPDDVPAEFAEKHAAFAFEPAEPQEPARFDHPIRVGGMSPEQLDRVWAPAKARHLELQERLRGLDPATPRELPPDMADVVELAGRPRRVIGIAGRAGSGKNAVASMIPGAFVVQLADPLYAMLAAMLGTPEPLLRHREFKESAVPYLGKSVRQLLQTLGTEWGRQYVGEDVWIRMLERRLDALAEQGIRTVAVADLRFANEADYLRSIGGEVWHVRRPGVDGPAEHESEAGIMADPADVVIDNAGTLDDLRQAVQAAFSRQAAAA